MSYPWAERMDSFPAEPGVYLMKGAKNETIYVGKAKNLRSRIRQYFGATSDQRFFVGLLDQLLVDIEVIITANDKEAFILENELIKRHQPRFNVELKDDKSFLHIRIDERVDWPRLDVVRRPKRDGARYFGPYHSASQIRETLKVIERHFQLRNCDDLTFKNRSRPCLQYQIKRCPGPCVLPVARGEYLQNTNDVTLFLQGRSRELAEVIREKMKHAASQMAYERAARYRDQLKAIEGSLQTQQMVGHREIDRDVFGIYREGSLVQLVVLLIRRGRMVGSRGFGFDGQGATSPEAVSTFCNLFYNGGNPVPDQVLLPCNIDGEAALCERLEELRGRKVELSVPRRGHPLRLMEMAERNAEHAFFQARRTEAVRDGGLVRLKTLLGLSNLPYRIECYDISIFQGEAAVGSRVVFEGGVPKRRDYRHYTIKTVSGTDDFAMMREVLMRRLQRGLKEGDLPHLIVVDGGKGQLNVARAVFEDLGIEGVDLAGLAKARTSSAAFDSSRVSRSAERVFRPGVKTPIALRPHTDELFLMTQLRDEAHRFAINHHRNRRGQRRMRSVLDDVPGVGPQRRKALLRAFGSIKSLKTATLEEIAAVDGIGRSLAETIVHHFTGEG